jgi:transcriptional regulator with XRE-family HTH domain
MAKGSKVKAGLESPWSADPQELARRLKVARTACGLSQELVANEFGISSRSVSQWEMAKAMPKAEKMVKLAQLYGVPMEWLWGQGEIPQGLPEVQRVSRHRIFISHSSKDQSLLARALRSAENDAPLAIPVIEKIPSGKITDLRDAATIRTTRMLPDIMADLQVEPENLVIIKVPEDTNEPEIRRGAYVLIDTSANDIRGSRNYYIFTLHGQMNLIRRISPEHSRGRLGYLLKAGNESVETMIVGTHGDIKVLGRVVGVLNPL